ncbi:hypothetical protein OIV83_001645 [Microbotryomycetes sp. JL201]|nr:hypothetical protein OIV83_001645 [Microbotryomycetes sp. JL201]
MTPDIIRDSTFGQLVNWATSGRVFPYEDQKPGYIVPAKYLNTPPSPLPRTDTGVRTLVDSEVVTPSKSGSDIEKGSDKPVSPAEPEKYAFLVEFDEGDPDRPHNWTRKKRVFVGFLVAFLTFSVYVGSAIYTSAIPSIMADFGVSQVVAILGLSMFVFAYGFGPMLLSPMQEMPTIGRNPPYIIGLGLFVIFQIPIILAPHISVILIFRFLSGFVGSPALATGGASMGDIFSPDALPAAIGIWSLGAVTGPILGPVIGGFAAQANGWRWPNLELLWITGFAFIVLFIALPETYEPTILVRRARRLRKLTGNPLIKAQAELDAVPNEGFFTIVGGRVKRAFQLTLEPAVLFVNIYIGLVYSIFYLWFEAFPLVFEGIYHFNLGLAGLPYLVFVISGIPTYAAYVWYQNKHIIPRSKNDPTFKPEDRLFLSLIAACFIPASLLLFGWSARTSVHWIVPIIGAGLYLPGIFLLFQTLIVWSVSAYPVVAASLLAGNALFRSEQAGAFPLFGRVFYERLTIGGGCSLLAGLSLLMIVPLWGLYKYGDRLRARSKWATA